MSDEMVLFVDDEAHLRLAVQQTLELDDITVKCFSDASRALEKLDRAFPGILVTDIKMPGMDGLEVLQKALEIDAELPVILVTGHGDVALAVDSMRRGAYDFLEKPFATNLLASTVKRALDKRRLTLENRRLRSAVGGRDRLEARLMGRTDIMIKLRRQIRAVAETDADILIIGETGTGKEVAARALHAIGPREEAPFVAINCGAIPADLLESELFGHEAGAFPGAIRARYGKFEHAQGGTIFLDEIESMPMALQVKLLRVIQDRSLIRLGSNESIPLNVRFIATSKIDLEDEAAAGRFRSDLLYRLNVITLRMPTLAQRLDDIPSLFTQLVGEACVRYKKDEISISADVLAAIASQPWKGNVRELRNAADRFALGLGLENDLQIDDHSNSAQPTTKLANQMAEMERTLIAAELTSNSGRLKDTYEALGLSRKSLYEKMQKHGLHREDFTRDDFDNHENG
ncbi:MAG: Fis family transcriptional regulator [Hyphomicrobiales bacterium]|nr:MAG: Fis family transcriptional regulator [Hyphomicrobiales bacterium]